MKIAKKYSAFINWFNGICALFFGTWMMLSSIPQFPYNWADLMPLSIFDGLPFHDIFFTSFFWPGVALILVNGVSNIVAIIMKRTNPATWPNWCLCAGILLIIWTVTESLFAPNVLAVIYFVIGVLQVAAACVIRRA